MNTFSFTPSYTTEVEWTPKLITTQLGDGYDQQAPDGIQNDALAFNLVFENITDAERAEIVTFIKGQGGYIPFLWLPPAPYDGNGALMWKCAKYVDNFVEANSNTITLPFVQTFNPQ